MATDSDLLEIPTVIGQRSSPPDCSAPPGYRELTGYDWSSMGTGIALAGGAYPMLLAVVGSLIGMVVVLASFLTGGISLPNLGESLLVLLIVLAHTLTMGMFGLVWCGVVVIVALPVVYLFARSMRLRGSFVRFGALCGGLVGFLAVLPILVLVAREVNDWPTMIAAMAIGPGITTILGQIGGAWGASQPSYEQAVRRATINKLPPSSREATGRAAQSSEDLATPWIQFSVRHLLWIAVWVSLLLSVIRLTGIPFELMLPLAGGWLLYQALTLWIGGRVVSRLGPWWRTRRNSRST
jgi:hypothetical protein